jgi:nuclear pore complex protein Nup160
MEGHCLVATHLSSLNSSTPSSVVLSTARQNAPLPSHLENDVPAEHATYSSVLTTSTTGTLLLRVIHDGAVVELSALSTPVPPLRIIFPAHILSKPALFLWQETELYLLVVTDIGSLFYLVIPIDGFKLWQDQTGNVWHREYFIRNIPREHIQQCAFHAQGIHSVAITLPNGHLLRIEAVEAELLDYDGHEGQPFSLISMKLNLALTSVRHLTRRMGRNGLPPRLILFIPYILSSHSNWTIGSV